MFIWDWLHFISPMWFSFSLITMFSCIYVCETSHFIYLNLGGISPPSQPRLASVVCPSSPKVVTMVTFKFFVSFKVLGDSLNAITIDMHATCMWHLVDMDKSWMWHERFSIIEALLLVSSNALFWCYCLLHIVICCNSLSFVAIHC